MHLSSEPSRRYFKKWTTLFGILFMHVAMLWTFKFGGNQKQIETVQYLSLFNLPPVEKLTNKANQSQPPKPNLAFKGDVTKIRISEAIANAPKMELDTTIPNTPAVDVNSKLNLDTLRGQAVQIERTRVKSDIEKMNDSKKLNLSVEATFDREINKIELPECHKVLLGKSMPERMRIIQDHSKKKFCR